LWREGIPSLCYPDIDLALLRFGGRRVLGIMVAMDRQHGVDVLRIIYAKMAIPIRHNDYDVLTSPL
jgi:L-ascorbate metabolism protein UlaG (beta-lactamase superfamily)